VVGLTFYAYEREMRVLSERSDEIFWFDERGYAGEVGVEEVWDGAGVFFEDREVRGWKEERAGERPILRRVRMLFDISVVDNLQSWE
jgi:hypothetical protein